MKDIFAEGAFKQQQNKLITPLNLLLSFFIRVRSDLYKKKNNDLDFETNPEGKLYLRSSVVDLEPNPNWIRIQDLCGSGSRQRITGKNCKIDLQRLN